MTSRFSRLCLTAALTAITVLSSGVRADDTDIYFTNGNNGKLPYVMFSIDMRSSTTNNGQVTCTGTAQGTESPAGSGNFVGEGCLHYFKRVLPEEFCAASCTAAETAAGKISGFSDFWTYLRLSLAKALKDFEGQGIKVGFMVSHLGNNCAGNTATNCTNGGMITLGFTELASNVYINSALSGGANITAQQAINAQMKAAKNVMANSNYAASNQTAETFFELFRYLRGGQVYNGHNGWSSFDANKGGSSSVNVRPEHCTNYVSPLGAAPGRTTTNDTPGGNGYLDSRSAMCWDNTIETPNNTSAPTTASYISPLGNNAECNAVTTINFYNGQVNQDAESNSAIAQSVANGGMGLSTPSAAAVVGALYDAAQHPEYGIPSVTSYFLGSNQSGPELPTLAAAGGTPGSINVQSGDPAADPGYVVKILSNILGQVKAISTSFVATAVPVNAFNKAQVLDNAFLALFKPDQDGKKIWNGDLKKLKIQNGSFVDALGQTGPLVISTDGRIAPSVLTFWTDVATLPPTGFDSTEATATTDGRAVNRGGAGQKIPGYIAAGTNTKPSPGDVNATGFRNMWWDNGSTLAPLNVDTSASPTYPTILKTALDTAAGTCIISGIGSPTTDQCTSQLIRWIRGQDVGTPNSFKALTLGSLTTEAPYPPRSWLLGDPLHSRPLPLDYGATQGHSTTNPAVYIAMGGNDGALHFFENTTAAGAESGKELWAFMPRKSMGIQKELAFNTVTMPLQHGPYGLDGTPTAFMKDANGDGSINGTPCGTTLTSTCEGVFLYLTMRRGGKYVYALDTTDPLTPSFRWSIGQDQGVCNSSACPVSGSSTAYSELGLTFSVPTTGMVRVNGQNKLAMFFGGGYDTNKDQDAVGTNDSSGNAIYIVDASDGTLLWKAVKGTTTGPESASNTNTKFTHVGLTDSIPSSLSAVDTDGDGLIDRIVTGDTGGNLWRIDIPGDDRSQWALTRIAKLGRWYADANGVSTKADDRRFFYPPDIVQTLANDGSRYDAYPLGSGDREDPLDKGLVTTNYFYAVRDNCTQVLSWDMLKPGAVSPPACVARYPILQNQIDDVTDDCLQGKTNSAADLSTCGVTNGLSYGWKFLLGHPSGEKSLSEAQVFFNVIYFTTYLPTNDSSEDDDDEGCGPPAEGRGIQYAVALSNGTAAYNNGNPGNTGTPTDASDRSYELASGGIPAQDVFLPTATGLYLLTPDQCKGTCSQPKGTTRLRTFWQRVEETPP